MNDVERIMQMITWDNDEETQEKGLELAKEIENWELFIRPMYYGSYKTWENCAKILYEKPDELLEPFLIPLLEWVKDINVPGAYKILNRLMNFSPKKLCKPLECCINKAVETNEDIWLDYLSDLLNNEGLEKLLSDTNISILQSHYMNWHLDERK